MHEGRAEDIAQQSPQHYDVTVARAVWDTDTLLAVSADLLRPQGRAIAMHSTQQHANAPQHVPPYITATRVPYTLPHGVERALTVYSKA